MPEDLPPPAPPPERSAAPHWRDELRSQAPELRRSLSRRKRAFAVLLVMLGLSFGVAVLLYWLRSIPHADLSPLYVAEYPDRPLPAPAFAAADRDALLTSGLFPHVREPEFPSPPAPALLQELADLRHRPATQPVVLLLSGYALTSGPEREVSVLPADADPVQSESRVPLRAILDGLKACPARHKLLILDIMAPVADARLGVLTNDVAAGVQAQVGPIEAGGCLVLCACSPGQVSLASEDMGRTVFSYYLEEGLRGWADGCNPRGARDGQVSVGELAAFVRARVDRWAARNRHTTQTPMLLGSAADFALTTLERGQPRPHLFEAPLQGYPDWLRDSWKVRDRWHSEENFRTAPLLFRQLEVTLLQAERDWRSGVPSDRCRDACKEHIAALESRLKQIRAIALPEPPSLALAQGREPDRGLRDALRAALERVPAPAAKAPPAAGERTEPPPPLRPSADLLKKLEGKSHFEVAWAAFEALANDPDPQPDKVRFLNGLLQSQELRPVFVETLLLQRLGELADRTGAEAWPGDAVRRALEVVRTGEAAGSQPEALPWVRSLLDEAAQKRHDGEVLLWANGYAAPADAERELRQAGEMYHSCLHHAQTVQQVRRGIEDALAFLPAATAYIEEVRCGDDEWLAAVAAVHELNELLHGQPTPGAVVRADDLRQRETTYREKLQQLQEHMQALRQPFSAERLAELKRHSQRPNATPTVLQDIEAVLRAPFLSAEERAGLWQAGRALARRLHEETIQLDAAEDARQAPMLALTTAADTSERLEAAERERAVQRARLSIALLSLGEFDATEVRKLHDALQQTVAARSGGGAFAGALDTLARSLGDAWNVTVPPLLKAKPEADDAAIQARDQLSRICTPFANAPLAEEAKNAAALVWRQRQARALWTWRAERNRYEARDNSSATAAAFYTLAARGYQQLAGPLPEETHVEVRGTPRAVQLTPASPTSRYVVDLQQQGGDTTKKAEAEVRVFRPDSDWVQVRLDPRTAAGAMVKGGETFVLPLATFAQLPLQFDLQSGAVGTAEARPLGVLLQVRVNGRTAHQLVPLSLQAVADQLDVLLSSSAAELREPQHDLRLRPVPGRQRYFLHVQNPTARPRNVTVQLLSNDVPVPGGETRVTLGAHETKPALFGGAAAAVPPSAPAPLPAAGTPAPPTAPAEAELKELPGPLQVRLLDADNKNALLSTKAVHIGIASPREYTQVTGVQFLPPDPQGAGQQPSRTRLAFALRASRPLASPLCPVDLVLPSSIAPGRTIKDGTLHGELPSDGAELKLYADNLQLRGSPEEGAFYVNVDGWDRAYVYRATLARQGDPLTPREDRLPEVRIGGGPFAASSPKYAVDLEVDNAPDDATLEVSLGRFVQGLFEAEAVKTRPSPRRRHIGFALQEGALVLEASVKNWAGDRAVALDTNKIVGPRDLRVRLLDANGTPLRTVFQTVTFDDSPPDKVAFIEPPKQARRDLPLTLKAAAAPSVSGISQAVFFVGKPIEHKVPPNTPTFPGQPVDAGKTQWSATLPLPGDRKGPTELSVQLVNAVGQSEFATTTVELVEFDAAKARLGKVQGKVLEGEREQPDLTVLLRDEKGAQKDKTTTKSDGSFVFENVAPGKYKVYASKVASTGTRKGEVPVQVDPGKSAEVKIPLYR